MCSENISNFVTDNQLFRKKSETKKKVDEYVQGEKKKVSYVDAVNTAHVNNINLSDIYLDFLKGEENNSSKTDISPSQFKPFKELRRRIVIYTR